VGQEANLFAAQQIPAYSYRAARLQINTFGERFLSY
jgi:hypothetical protein